MKIVFLGLSITSSWGNGHATTYRGLVRELANRGHEVLFLERDMPWYAQNRDLPKPPYGRTELYTSLEELQDRFEGEIAASDLAVVGSYVPEGAAAGKWVTSVAKGLAAFYDIDTPVTLSKLERGETEYLTPELIPRYDLYLSFTGGPILERIEREFGAPRARVLYCSADPSIYYPDDAELRWDLGYLGTYSADRQGPLNQLLIEPARQWPAGRFVVAGPLYPAELHWLPNVERIEHLSPNEHRCFYNSQRLTLNVTRADMRRAGYSPSVRLFEAAACGTPIASDYWPGLESIFEIGSEILVAQSSSDILRLLREMPAAELRAIGNKARARVLAEHTAERRACQLESYAMELLASPRPA